jgi:hypothetical protein
MNAHAIAGPTIVNATGYKRDVALLAECIAEDASTLTVEALVRMLATLATDYVLPVATVRADVFARLDADAEAEARE